MNNTLVYGQGLYAYLLTTQTVFSFVVLGINLQKNSVTGTNTKASWNCRSHDGQITQHPLKQICEFLYASMLSDPERRGWYLIWISLNKARIVRRQLPGNGIGAHQKPPVSKPAWPKCIKKRYMGNTGHQKVYILKTSQAAMAAQHCMQFKITMQTRLPDLLTRHKYTFKALCQFRSCKLPQEQHIVPALSKQQTLEPCELYTSHVLQTIALRVHLQGLTLLVRAQCYLLWQDLKNIPETWQAQAPSSLILTSGGSIYPQAAHEGLGCFQTRMLLQRLCSQGTPPAVLVVAHGLELFDKPRRCKKGTMPLWSRMPKK